MDFLTIFFENRPVPSFLTERAALGNLKVNFHCAHLHSFFPLKKASPLFSVFFNSLYAPFGSPVSGGQKPQGERGNRPIRCSNRFAIRLAGHQRSRQKGYAGWDRLAL